LFHIRILINKNNVDALFYSCSHTNLIVGDLVSNNGLDMHDFLHSYPLGWVNKDVELKFCKQCKVRFVNNANFIDEIEVDVILLNVWSEVLNIPYMYMRDSTFKRRENQYPLSRMVIFFSSMYMRSLTFL
jgi:hypothetical protein